MAANETSLVVCPCCSARLGLADDLPETIVCRSCRWEFTTDIAGMVDDDGDIEGESELEIDDEGELIVPTGGVTDTHFPPWHGSASAALEWQARGLRDSGDFIDPDQEPWDFDPYDESYEDDTERRGMPDGRLDFACPNCGRLYRNQQPGQLFCSDCGWYFSVERDYDAEDDYGDQYDKLEEAVNKGERDASIFAAGPPMVVAPDGSGAYRNLADAIRQHECGRPILLRPGLHEAFVHLNRPIHLIGDGPREAIILRGPMGSPPSVSQQYAVLRNVTLQGLARLNGRADAAVDMLDGTIEDCDITSDSIAGVRMVGGLLHRCRVRDGEQAGIIARGGDIVDCEIAHNGGPGVLIEQPGVLVSTCRIHDGFAEGVKVGPMGRGLLLDCDLFHNKGAGVRIEGMRTSLWNCRIRDGRSHGVVIADRGGADLRNCNVFGNRRSGVYHQGAMFHGWHTLIHDGPGPGIAITGAGKTVLDRCAIYHNQHGGVRKRHGCRNPILRATRVFKNG